jgi:hypothetical protein
MNSASSWGRDLAKWLELLSNANARTDLGAILLSLHRVVSHERAAEMLNKLYKTKPKLGQN